MINDHDNKKSVEISTEKEIRIELRKQFRAEVVNLAIGKGLNYKEFQSDMSLLATRFTEKRNEITHEMSVKELYGSGIENL